jgi:serine/threonine-protein kinase
LIVFLLANSDFGDEGTATPTLDVPSVTGLGYAQAEAGLKALGFTVARQDVDEPEQVPDLVLSQDPEQGRKIPKGGTITLKVSSATIVMPTVVGQTKVQATQTLAAKNLTPNFVEQDSDQTPGTVINSDPAAGGAVPKLPQGGRPTVTVIVAREPLIPVPDVTPLDPFAAAATLGNASFKVTPVNTPSDTVPVGKVIGTDPAVGTPLPKGAEVKLLVSSGPDLVTVPNVVGAQRAQAEALLNTTLGFGVQVSFVNAGPTRKGVVVAQNPAPNTQAQKGSAVAIVVGL